MAIAVSNSVSLPTLSGTNGTLTDEYINGLVQGGSWQFGSGPRTLTYSFNINFDFDPFGNIVPGSGGNWTVPLIDAVNRALAEWSKVANVNFQNIASGTYFYQSNADIAFTLTGTDLQSEFGAVGLGIFPDPVFANELRDALEFAVGQYPNPTGDVFFDNYYSGYQYLYAGGFGYEAILHEIGHALGLKHPNDDGGNARPTFEQLGITANDTERWTLMSGNGVTGSTLSTGNAASPMVLDILAIQQIYGANMSYHAGNDDYQLGPYNGAGGFGAIYQSFWDAGGIDTIHTFGITDGVSGIGVSIDLRPGIGFVRGEESIPGNLPFTIHTPQIVGTFSMTYTAIAYNVVIENAVGTAFNDSLLGNDVNNVLDGGAGADQLAGSLGNDTYVVDNIADVVVELPGEGSDTVRSALSVTLPANVENLILMSSANVNGTGNSQDNILTGNSGNNSLTGGLGNDTLDGGTGIDKALYSGLASSYSVLRNGSSFTVSGPDGTDTLTNIEFLQFGDGTRALGAKPGSDFGGDGKSDILWHNDNGQVYLWTMNGAAITGGAPVSAASPDWHIAGTGDHNGDSKSDILWHNDNGQVYLWTMDGATITGGASVSAASPDWHIAESGDYNGDGKSDILWHNDNGQVYLWTMNGATITGGASVSAASPDWHIAESGDYNGDGKSDILWHNDNGQVYLWTMDGATITGGASVSAASPDWHIAESGDYNGDGKSDILWHNDNGQVYLWTMDGATITGGASVSAASPDWHIANSGDYNGDGKSDILWHNDNGQVYLWTMDGATITGGASVSAASPDWHIQG